VGKDACANSQKVQAAVAKPAATERATLVLRGKLMRARSAIVLRELQDRPGLFSC
jgi:hypothetical protein